MTKPMYCPMSFIHDANNKVVDAAVCTPDCAWAFFLGESYGCSIAYIAASVYSKSFPIAGCGHNARPLEDDADDQKISEDI